MQTITPVLFVDTIEPSLPFWEGLDFEQTGANEIFVREPGGHVIGFAEQVTD